MTVHIWNPLDAYNLAAGGGEKQKSNGGTSFAPLKSATACTKRLLEITLVMRYSSFILRINIVINRYEYKYIVSTYFLSLGD